MNPRLLSRRDIVGWAIGFLCIATLLVATRFTSDDPDSALYAAISARLAEGPVSHWIAPQWWGHWDSEGLFREHPAGIYLLPTLLGALGVPGVQAAYIVGIAAGLATVVLLSFLVARVTSIADGRATLVLLQLIPLAFIFRIRANHEYPMLVCLLVAVFGIEAVRRSWRHVWITPLALCAAVLVKAAFVAVPFVALGWWLLCNPLRASGSLARAFVTLALSALAIVAMAAGYDVAYAHVTGEGFWSGYWARQMAPLSIGGQPGDGHGVWSNLGFYAVRLVWHPAPWSLALLAAAWTTRRRQPGGWSTLSTRERRGLVFALGFALTTVLMLAPASRFAERYVFSANYVLATAGLVVALHVWPPLRAAMARLDERVPALPAVCWTLLMLLRLIVGPLLPRITS